MTFYRISNETFREDISGNGAAINGSRWNSVNVRMLYTSGSISLCILESLVHLKIADIPPSQFLLKIEIPDSVTVAEISSKKIKQGWEL
jgi:RES domain-containing protein